VAAFVLTDEKQQIASFCTLANTSIVKSALSKTKQRDYPYPHIAAVIISYLGVQEQLRGNKLGPKTLQFALMRCFGLTQYSGCMLVVVDVETKNETAKKMYHEADFEEMGVYTTGSGYELLRLMIPMRKIAAAAAQGAFQHLKWSP
jgi:hypothetical protein